MWSGAAAAAAGSLVRRPGGQRPGTGVGAEPAVAHAGQGDAGGARAEGGEHGVQPGHPLRQQDELPAAAAGHQQEPPAQELRPRRRGERQQQLRHQQVRTHACAETRSRVLFSSLLTQHKTCSHIYMYLPVY